MVGIDEGNASSVKGGTEPRGGSQTSGKVIRSRPGHMNDAGNVENTTGLPTRGAAASRGEMSPQGLGKASESTAGYPGAHAGKKEGTMKIPGGKAKRGKNF